MKAKIRSTELYFDVSGAQFRPNKNGLLEEKPVLFLLHGGPGGNHIHFKFDSMELEKVAQLVFIDQRGCGMSKKTKASDYTLENNIEDIEALRKHLGLKKISLLGISYGGIVAQGYAIKYSKYLENLILVVTSPSHHFIDDAKAFLNKHGTELQRAICDRLLWPGNVRTKKDVSQYLKALDPLYFYSKPRRRKIVVRDKNKKIMKIDYLSPAVLNKGFSTFLRDFNFIPKLKKIHCPTLVLAGKHDWICSARQSIVIANNIKNAKLKIFSKCGHAITYDAKPRYLKAVSEFLLSNKKG